MKHAGRIAAAGVLTLAFAMLWSGPAFAEPPVDLEAELSDDLLEDDLSEDELDELIESYFSKIESGAIGTEDIQSDVVTNPALLLTEESDGVLRYTFPNGNFFLTTVPQGMISSQPVDLSLSSGIVGVLRKDDVLNVMPESWHFSAPGNYHIKMLSYQSGAETVSNNYNVEEVNCYFTIVGAVDGRLGAVPAPDGFEIEEVRLDGQERSVDNRRCFFLTEDGRYEIQYVSGTDEPIRLSTVFVHDTTAPFLTFSKELDGKEADGPLEFYPSEPDCKIGMSFNGEKGYAVTNVLTTAGNYELRVEDAAGNQRSYHLRIRQTYDWRDARIVLIGVVFLAGLAVWLVFTRRNMRVL